MNIRYATLADLPDIVAIYNESIPSRMATADLEPITVHDRETWFQNHGENRPVYIVKDENEIPLAWGSFSDFRPRKAYHISAEISIYVSQKARKQGLGSKILQFMLNQAPALGITNILAVIFAHNTPSIRMFTALGFQQWGLMPGLCDLDGKPADLLILGKAV